MHFFLVLRDRTSVGGFEFAEFTAKGLLAGVEIHVELERMLLRELFGALGASERSHFLVDRFDVVLQRSIRRQLQITNIADGLELVMIEIVRCPFLFRSIASLAQIACRFSSRRFGKVVVGRLTSFALETFFVAFQLALVCEILIAVGALHVRLVVNGEGMLIKRSSIRKDGIFAKIAFPSLSYVQMNQVHVLVE